MFQKLKIPILIVVTAILTQFAGRAVQAAMPPALLPAGTTRYAAVSATNSVSTTSETFVDVPNTTVWITVPQGQTADVMIHFCGEMGMGSFDGVHIQGRIGSVLAAPGPYIVKQHEILIETECVQFYKTGITAGNKAVMLQWKVNAGGSATVYERSVIVTVNHH